MGLDRLLEQLDCLCVVAALSRGEPKNRAGSQNSVSVPSRDRFLHDLQEDMFGLSRVLAEAEFQLCVRHPELAAYSEESEEDPIEAEAHRRGLQYVRLGGDIGVIGNGAGLVMNTLDLVQREGGRAANFLDIGGGAKAEVVHSALELINSDPNVKGILINIFGGITRGDEVARGVIDASRDLGLTVPLVVRLTGTREDEGRRLLQEAGITPKSTATEAAHTVVELAREASR